MGDKLHSLNMKSTFILAMARVNLKDGLHSNPIMIAPQYNSLQSCQWFSMTSTTLTDQKWCLSENCIVLMWWHAKSVTTCNYSTALVPPPPSPAPRSATYLPSLSSVLPSSLSNSSISNAWPSDCITRAFAPNAQTYIWENKIIMTTTMYLLKVVLIFAEIGQISTRKLIKKPKI